MKRFVSVLTALLVLFLAVSCAFAEGEETTAKTFEWDGTTYTYEVVTEDMIEEVVGTLSQYAKTDGEDMETNKLFYLHYISAEKDGQELNLGRAVMNLPLANIRFIVNGIEYIQTGILMSSGRGIYLTYLVVPADTTDDAEVSIEYRE